jgi:ATP-dependent exoDNAse (exonuclease V) alpha subunit
MLINFTNHPFEGWSQLQKDTAITSYGEVIDLPFPVISPTADEIDIKLEAKKYLKTIIDMNPDAVHIMGEMNFTFQMIFFLLQEGIECIASTTTRDVENLADGTQRSNFHFHQFRKYNFLIEDTLKKEVPKINLSDEQTTAFDAIKSFLAPNNDTNVFILKGYAGTGKTTLISFIADYCKTEKINVNLLASTGRAASILRKKVGFNASTIHSMAYRFNGVKEKNGQDWESDVDETGQIYLNFEVSRDPDIDFNGVFIVDEASMVSGFTDNSQDGVKFGSGNTLGDLFKLVGDAKVIFVGDPCQLPPVAKISKSIALSAKDIQTEFGKKVMEYELKEIQRQGENSDILDMSLPIRDRITSNNVNREINLVVKHHYKDVKVLANTEEIIKKYIETFRVFGFEQCVMITTTNKEALANNLAIKKFLQKGSNKVQVGDLLMVTKNCMLTGLRNGDQVKILEIGTSEFRNGLNLLNVRIKDINSGNEYATLLIESLLYGVENNLNTEKNRDFLIDFDKRMRERKIRRNSEDYKRQMRTDKYVNALQANFGYSVTVQKAQGGEWKYVFLNINNSVYAPKYNNQSESIFKWFYTAVTRTQKYLFINKGGWIKLEI